MEVMDFLAIYGDRLVLAVFAIVTFIVTFIRTGSISKSLKECDIMKYRSANAKTADSQSFTNQRTDYVLNPVTNELEKKDEPIDVQKEINSVRPSTLDEMLDTFLPTFPEAYKTAQAECRELVDDMYELGHAMEVAEEYREKFDLPDTLSVSQIYDYIGERHTELSKKLSELKTVKAGGEQNAEVPKENPEKAE